MKVLSTAILMSSMMISSFTASAGDLNDIQLGHPGVRGTGCPAGTVDTTLSPDKKSLSILFDEYVLEAGPSIGKKMARKNCTIAIPVHVPNGFSVSIMAVDYRGYNYLPSRAQAVFSAEYFFAGQRGPKLRKSFRGGIDDEYTVNSKIAVVANVWSKCGDDVNLRIATSMRLRNMNRSEDAMSTVDSADINAGIVYQLQYKKCGAQAEEEDDLWGDDDWF
jgi:hypothetical protein